MILVTGSTGHFGKSAIGFLLKKGMQAGNIAALARNSEKAASLSELGVQVIKGNYDDYESLVNAFINIDIMLFISGSETDKRDLQHENILKAASESRIKHIIYTSFERKDDDPVRPESFITRTHILTEQKIIETGIIYTFLRNALYAEGLPLFLGENVVTKGVYFPAGNGRVPFASITDMSESAANILLNPGVHVNKSYRTVNIHNYSFYEIAAILGELTGKNVRYFCPPADEFIATMIKSGLPVQTVKGIATWANAIKDGYFESEHSDMEMLLGRKPKDLKTVLSKLYTKAEITR